MSKKSFIYIFVGGAALGCCSCLPVDRTTLLDAETGQAAAGVPDYYKSHVADKLTEIAAAQNEIGKNGDAFVFITDTHTDTNHLTSAKLIGDVCRQTGINKVIFGGDLVPAYGSERQMYQCADKQIVAFEAEVRPFAAIYNLYGNHDLIIKDTAVPDHPVSYTASDSIRYELLMKKQEPYVHADKNNPLGGYFYFDNPEPKIRYVCLNGFERHSDSKTTWSTLFGISPAQLTWLTSQALVMPASGWSVGFFCHNDIIPETTDKNNPVANFQVLKGILDALALKTKYAYSGSLNNYTYNVRVDYTHDDTKVLFFLAGHHHKDAMAYQNRLPHILTTCDAKYTDDGGTPRQWQTTDESAFDVMCVNAKTKTIHAVRVGARNSRVFHYDSALWILVGERGSLHSQLANIAEWTSSNGAMATVTNGTVTGNSTGEATICAISKTGEKEYFDVIIK